MNSIRSYDVAQTLSPGLSVQRLCIFEWSRVNIVSGTATVHDSTKVIIPPLR